MTTLPGVLPFDDGDNSVASHAAWLRGLQAAVFNPLPLTEFYQSADQAITTQGLLVLAHGLGVTPTLLQGYLKCITAEQGYSVGDITPVRFNDSSAASIVPDATNITVRFANTAAAYWITNKSLGTLVAATNANWTFFVRAWA